MHLNDKAQLSTDFLGGFVIVFFSLITVLIFIPTTLSTLQNPGVDLHSVAYRTAVLLSEDPGWWNNTTAGQGYDWEKNLNNTRRIGLSGMKYNKSEPCILDGNKTLAFTDLYNKSDPASYGKIQDLLGLNTTLRKYDYNLTFKSIEDNKILVIRRNVSGTVKRINMTFGNPIPISGNVEKFMRAIVIGAGLNPSSCPDLPGLDVNTQYYPNWPEGHEYDAGKNDNDKGDNDRPLLLTYPLQEFRIYDLQKDPSATAKGDLEIYVANSNFLTNSDVYLNNNTVVGWGYSSSNKDGSWDDTGFWNGLDWIIDLDSGMRERLFESEINAKLKAQGAVEGDLFHLTIRYHNLKGKIYAYSGEWMEDTLVPSGNYISRSLKLEVYVW